MDFLEMVRQDLEALLRDRSDADKEALLRELAAYRSDWESAQSLDEKIKRARSFLAREMLGIVEGGELASKLRAIEEKLDRVLALLESNTLTKEAELKSNAPAGAGKEALHKEEELFRDEGETRKSFDRESERGELRHPEQGSGQLRHPERSSGQLSARAARVLRLLEEQGGASFKEVQNALSLSREEVLEAVSELFDKGRIRKEGVKYVPR